MGCGGGAVGGQPTWWMRQHHSFLSAAQVFSGSTAQLKGSTGPLGAGGLVGGGGAGRVGGGVGSPLPSSHSGPLKGRKPQVLQEEHGVKGREESVKQPPEGQPGFGTWCRWSPY